jgi:hypothetical protein
MRLILRYGDCIETMRSLQDRSVSALVSDPPYGLEFMGKEWDRLEPSRNQQRWAGTERKLIGDGTADNWLGELPNYRPNRNKKCRNCGHYRFSGTPCTCETPDWDARQGEHLRFMQAWHVEWLVEVRRILVPGAPVRIFSGSKTYHRLAAAMEEVGFQEIDVGAWCYGSGFPKNLDIGKALDALVLTGRTDSKGIREANDARPRTGRTVSGMTGTLMNVAALREDYKNTFEQRDVWHETTPATEQGRRFHGHGTALKPAWEPVLMGRA